MLAAWMWLGCAGSDTPPSSSSHDTAQPSDDDSDDDGYLVDDDCDDTDATIYPHAWEHCDGVDEDCDGVVDEDAIDATKYYVDADGDGYGLADAPLYACSTPDGFADNHDDCDDTDAEINPAAVWYHDGDGDGFGTVEVAYGCARPVEAAYTSGDCDDTRAETYPAADEICDDLDNDCDEAVDDDAVDAPTWYADLDRDRYGDVSTEVYACAAPKGLIGMGFDCDDADPGVHPLVVETCDDAEDLDCSGHPSNGCVVDTLGEVGWTFQGEGVYDSTGASVANGGDIDGDGKDDLLVAGPYAGYYGPGPDYAGIVYVVYGNTSAETWQEIGSTSDAAIVGDAERDGVGMGLESAGDVNADGFADTFVGAMHLDSTACSYCGDARVFYGPLDGLLTQVDADVDVVYDVASAHFGDVASRGDFDGDGRDDVVVGGSRISLSADTFASPDGALYFFRGPPDAHLDYTAADATLLGDEESALGSGLTSLADTDGDGISDLAVGAPGGPGSVMLFLGPISGILDSSSADVTYAARHVADWLGTRCEWAGDVDGDGSLDLAMSAPGDETGGDRAGAAYLVYGPLERSIDMSDADASIYGEWDWLGVGGLAEGADLDGDGFDDLFVGSPYDGATYEDAGAAYVYYGPLHGPRSASSADYILVGPYYNAYAGMDVAVLDFDGDASLDLVIGAPNLDLVGAAFVVPGTEF